MEKKNTNKTKPFLFLILGVLLVVFAIGLLLFDRFKLIKDEVVTEIEMKKDEEKYNEDLKDGIVDEEEINDNVVDDNQEDGNDNNGNNNNNNNGSSNNNGGKNKSSRYLGYLTIPKINLKTGIPWKDSSLNNVDKGVYTLPSSNYPDIPNGNLILAAHSGNASISYFKNLYKLKLGDVANVSYNGKTYSYKIVDIYYVEKTGTIQIRRNNTKTVLTLITCTKNSDTQQTVYILELYAIDGVAYG